MRLPLIWVLWPSPTGLGWSSSARLSPVPRGRVSGEPWSRAEQAGTRWIIPNRNWQMMMYLASSSSRLAMLAMLQRKMVFEKAFRWWDIQKIHDRFCLALFSKRSEGFFLEHAGFTTAPALPIRNTEALWRRGLIKLCGLHDSLNLSDWSQSTCALSVGHLYNRLATVNIRQSSCPPATPQNRIMHAGYSTPWWEILLKLFCICQISGA